MVGTFLLSQQFLLIYVSTTTFVTHEKATKKSRLFKTAGSLSENGEALDRLICQGRVDIGGWIGGDDDQVQFRLARRGAPGVGQQ